MSCIDGPDEGRRLLGRRGDMGSELGHTGILGEVQNLASEWSHAPIA